MLVFLWGRKRWPQNLGAVADWCETCQRVQAFTVTNYWESAHVCGISVGRHVLAETLRDCWDCGSEFYSHPEEYDGFLPESEAKQLPSGELLRRTNARLQARLEASRPAPGPVRRLGGGRSRRWRPPWTHLPMPVVGHLVLFVIAGVGLFGLVSLFLLDLLRYDWVIWLAFPLNVSVLLGNVLCCLLQRNRRPAALARVAAFTLLALGTVAVLTAEVVRGVQGWPANPDCYPPVAGPGDNIRVSFPQTVEAVGGHWRGSVAAEVTDRGDSGLLPVALTGSSRDDQWGKTIRLEKGEQGTKKARLWAMVEIPDSPQLAGQVLSLRLTLQITYPRLRKDGRFEEDTREFIHTAQLHLAADRYAGMVYRICLWLGILLSDLVPLMTFWLSQLATPTRDANGPQRDTLEIVSDGSS
jgi:hypothetical protein